MEGDIPGNATVYPGRIIGALHMILYEYVEVGSGVPMALDLSFRGFLNRLWAWKHEWTC